MDEKKEMMEQLAETAAEVMAEPYQHVSSGNKTVIGFLAGLITGIGGTVGVCWIRKKIKAKQEIKAAEADDDFFEDEVDPS